MEKHVQEALEKAELGDREAAFELGERYYEGRGCPKITPWLPHGSAKPLN